MFFFATNKNTILFAQGKKHPTIIEYLQEFKSIKPCISGCDAHSCQEIEQWLGQQRRIMNESDPDRVNVEKKIIWIKADVTFGGLKQILNEVDRVYIGEIPPIKIKVQENRTKYINKIKINPISKYDGNCGKWFQNVEIPLNSELVAIIGHKGSGKSALADIVALCANYKNQADFSFLNNKKFRDGKHAKNFEATISWESDTTNIKTLDNSSSNGEIELVKYLPQGYFERLTNEISSAKEFQKEIEDVVFTHLEDDKKVGATSFDGLINGKKDIINHEINQLKEELSIINKSIFEKEKKLNPVYKANLEAQIKKKKDELSALIEPLEIKNPDENPEIAEKNKVVNEKITVITFAISEIEGQIQILSDGKNTLLLEINEIKELKQKIKSREEEIILFRTSVKNDLLKYNIDNVITVKFDYTNIDAILFSKENSLKELKRKLGEESFVEEGFESLIERLSVKNSELKAIKETLGVEEKKYHDYLMARKKWENNKRSIIGDENTSNTLIFFEKELKYIDNDLLKELVVNREDRLIKVQSIYNKMKTILDIYKDVKSKIDSILLGNRDLLNQYKINIEASFCLKYDFQTKFFSYVSQNRAGTYYGKENAENQINKIIRGVNLDEYEQLEILLSNIAKSFFMDKRNDNRVNTFIDNQVDQVVELYDYLFSLDFLDYNYQLRQGNKNLEQLSPGEKGALLLIFYLLLDNNDIPLIIDQPEDNLDNNSVANVLVPFIKNAKTKRQIILVTHNPNLAVVADTEQVIYVELDKENNNLFSFKSGSIEDRDINDCIVKVLEGAMPAFNKRKQKYYDKGAQTISK